MVLSDGVQWKVDAIQIYLGFCLYREEVSIGSMVRWRYAVRLDYREEVTQTLLSTVLTFTSRVPVTCAHLINLMES